MRIFGSNLDKLFYPSGALLTFFILFSCTIVGQSDSETGLPLITNYPAKEYQAHPQNWAIVEDEKGIMYFGNSICLLEYDGVKWKKINFGNNTLVRSLAKDNNGRLYFGSTGNFGYLAPDSLGSMQLYSLLKYVPEPYRGFNDVWTIFPTSEGVYYQSRERLFRLRQNGDSWETKVWESPHKYMSAFFMDGIYYVHQQGLGLLKMVADSLMLIPGSEFIGNERMQVMLAYPKNDAGDRQYLLGLFYTGLYVFDGKTFKPFKTEADAILKSATLYKGAILKDSSYVLSTSGKGLVVINAQGKILQVLNRDVGLQDESVYAVYSDRKGALWLGLDNGISRVETSSPFSQFTAQSGITTSALSVARFEGTLYLGTTNGLMRFNSKDSRFKFIPSVETNQIFNLLPVDDILMVPTDGLYYIKNDKVNLIKGSVGGDLQVQSTCLLEKTPNVILAGVSGGVAIFAKKIDIKNRSSAWQYIGNLAGLLEDFWSIAESKDGSVWLGSVNGSVVKISGFFDKETMSIPSKFGIERYGTEHGLTTGAIHVFSVQGKEFFVSNSSVFRFDEQNKLFIPDSSFGDMGFGNDPNEYNMIADHKQRLWINFGKETALAISQPDGKYRVEKVQFLPFTDRVIYKIFPEKNGIVWFASNEGLIRYDEKLEKDYDQSYKTLLRYIKAGQTILNPDTAGYDHKFSAISYRNNALRFEYAAPFFDQEKKTRYQTWLEGFDNTWSDWDFNYYKEYTNLPEGSYTFHARAMNIYGKLSEEAVYTFTIHPPWWRTWWAYTMLGLLVIAIVWTFIYMRSRRLRRENRVLEEKISHRTTQLRQSLDELKSTQSQLIQSEKMASLGELTAGIAHEIQNPLNFVNNFSEVNAELIDEMKQQLKAENITEATTLADNIKENNVKITHHGKRADAIVKGMLQHSRNSTGQKEPTDINVLADECLRLSYHGMRAKEKSFNVTLKTDFDESLGKVSLIPQDIGRVLLNLFGNAFYSVIEKKKKNETDRLPGEPAGHDARGYDPLISVTTKKTTTHAGEKGFEIRIRDNGNGIPQKVLDKIFQPFFTTKPTGQGTGLGLSLSYDIIKAHNGDLNVETKEGQGAEFTIYLPA